MHTHTKKKYEKPNICPFTLPQGGILQQKAELSWHKKNKGKGMGRMCPMVPLCRLGSAGSQGFGFLAPVGMSRKCRITLGLEE